MSLNRCVQILPCQDEAVRCVCAHRLSGGRRLALPDPCPTGPLHVARLFFLNKKKVANSNNNKINTRFNSRSSPRVDWRHMKCLRAFSLAFYAGLPVERRNWMDNPKPEFLWVFGADKTRLLRKHSPSCSNSASRIWFFEALFGPHCGAHILKRRWWRWRGERAPSPAALLTSWPSAAFAVRRSNQQSVYRKFSLVYWTSL